MWLINCRAPNKETDDDVDDDDNDDNKYDNDNDDKDDDEDEDHNAFLSKGEILFMEMRKLTVTKLASETPQAREDRQKNKKTGNCRGINRGGIRLEGGGGGRGWRKELEEGKTVGGKGGRREGRKVGREG